VPTPPPEEQKEIVRHVEELFKFADQIEERYKKARSYTDKLTQSILAKAFRANSYPKTRTMSRLPSYWTALS
jgi:type I restriction enzyme, S subunit